MGFARGIPNTVLWGCRTKSEARNWRLNSLRRSKTAISAKALKRMLHPAATCANLRTAGCRACLARHKSYCACMFIHNSADVPRAAAKRMAIAAEIPDLPFSTRDKVTRVTRRCAAAADTAISPRYSRRTAPGWGGLCIGMNRLLVIVPIIDEHYVFALKLEDQTPVSADAYRPLPLKLTRQ